MKMMIAATRGVIRCLGGKPDNMVEPEADGIDSELSPLSIPDDYKTLISHCFRSVGLTEDHVSISVRPVGLRPSGLEVYAAFINVMRCDISTASLVAEMPQIEKMIDRGIRRTDLPRYSCFAGIRLRSSTSLDAFFATMQ